MAHPGETRPSPEALLELAARERRGKLKVFLGASPGVGKTYAMLSAARRLKAEGVDVVVGLVETHGRADTAALLEGLEIIPRRSVPYKGHVFTEFDVDAALKRHPQLIIVDELAHTNASESRHPKRFQDVEELLAAGIDVWTAVNIQHLESLSDVVSTITGVSVRELVPDTVIEKADDVVVVDITPDELIQRLKEGKVYLPDNARRAADNFLKPGNLTALRELALRRTADRVDDQMNESLSVSDPIHIRRPWCESRAALQAD
jgi:two-component system, OmpR family, sensor histidine kinase KdpD